MVFDMPMCRGCRDCEMACSFHHTGGFAPSQSRIRILNIENSSGYRVSFVENDSDSIKACTLCGECLSICQEAGELKLLLRRLAKHMRTRAS